MKVQDLKGEESAKQKQSAGKRRILVVEDFNETRFMMKVVLEMSGYHVLEATNGVEAVATARRERPDLILMDIGLPLMDGFAATRTIRAEAELADVAIVAVSAHATAEYRVKALTVGCDEYLTKPVDFAHLNNLVRRLLTRQDVS